MFLLLLPFHMVIFTLLNVFPFYFLSTWPDKFTEVPNLRSGKLVSKLQTSFWKEGTMLGVYKHPEI